MAADRAASARTLVLAMAHEIGNHLGAIRLEAHLLDEDLDPRSLARASVEIDGLAGRAGPLLALLRPLLSPTTPTTPTMPTTPASGQAAEAAAAPAWSSLLAGIAQHYADEGTRGVSLAIEERVNPDWPAPTADWLHSLLIALLDGTLAVMPSQGSIRLDVAARNGPILLAIEDDGPEEDLSNEAALRGRPLAVALARELLLLVGGHVETSRGAGGTRVELVFSA
jgi:signal transduction histidine kinase